MYRILFSRKAEKHKALLKQANLEKKARALLDLVSKNPFQNPPAYEKLLGEFSGAYSRRINHQHRFVYLVDEDKKEVIVLSMWTHYEF